MSDSEMIVNLHPVVRHLDLFSGIGGFALACRMVGGIETVAFCEREPYCQRVLAKHWPTVPICTDIHDLKGTEYGTVELITGGYPCQPFSLAGKRQGKDDDRHLWPELCRIVETARPRWCLFENVAGHVSLGLDAVLSDLASIGYSGGTAIVPACAVDARHRRDRLWIVGHSEGKRVERDRTSREQVSRPHDGEALSLRPGGNVADASGRKDHGRGRGIVGGEAGRRKSIDATSFACRENVPYSDDGINEAGGTQGNQRDMENGDGSAYGSWCQWPVEPDVGRVAHGIPARVDRLRGLGNAIVPQVAAEIIRAMMLADRQANKEISIPVQRGELNRGVS